MKKLLLFSLCLFLILVSFNIGAADVEKSPENLPRPQLQTQVVMGNFSTQGPTYATTVNLLFQSKYQQLEIKRNFNPKKIDPKEYFKKGLQPVFEKWNLDIKKFKFEILKYQSIKPTGAYEGYLIMVNTK